MRKDLVYTSDDQIIGDAVKMLLQLHLGWSGSDEKLPSRDLGCVRGMMDYAIDQAFPDCELKAVRVRSDELFDRACAIADAKWQAVMLMLGLDD